MMSNYNAIARKLDTADNREQKGLSDLVTTYVQAGTLIAAAIDSDDDAATSYRSVAILAEHTPEEWDEIAGKAKRRKATPQPARLTSYARAYNVARAIGKRDVSDTVETFTVACRGLDISPTLAKFVKFAQDGFKVSTLKPKAAKSEPFNAASHVTKLVESKNLTRSDVTAMIEALTAISDDMAPTIVEDETDAA